MSIETWKKQFQPVSPKEAAEAGDRAALWAWYRMWQGTTPEALQRHGIMHWIDVIGGPYNNTLCMRHSTCEHCPIVLVTGQTCVEATLQCTDDDTEPMRNLLEKVLRAFELKELAKP